MEAGETSATDGHTRPARLERIEEGRWVAGVPTGIAYYFNIPVWLVRVAFLLMITAGGLGLVMYLAGALLIPHETEDQSMVMRWADQMERPSQWIGAAWAVLGVSIFLGIFTNIGGGLIWVFGLIRLGVMLFRNDPADASSSEAVTETTDESGTSTSAALVGATSSPKARRVREPKARKMREPKKRKVRPPRPHSNLGRYTVAAALLVLSALGTADILDLMTPSTPDYFAVGLGITGLGW
jgi:phage shock protein PspC (stress-responsive transcriptional regulator)